MVIILENYIFVNEYNRILDDISNVIPMYKNNVENWLIKNNWHKIYFDSNSRRYRSTHNNNEIFRELNGIEKNMVILKFELIKLTIFLEIDLYIIEKDYRKI